MTIIGRLNNFHQWVVTFVVWNTRYQEGFEHKKDAEDQFRRLRNEGKNAALMPRACLGGR